MGPQIHIGYFPGMQSVIVLVGKSSRRADGQHVALGQSDEHVHRIPTHHRGGNSLIIGAMGGSTYRPAPLKHQMAALDNHCVLFKLSNSIRDKLRDLKGASVTVVDCVHMSYTQWMHFLVKVRRGSIVHQKKQTNLYWRGVNALKQCFKH